MHYIYHLIPEPMIGEKLIPLNAMMKDSELYKINSKKYEGRENLLEVEIPQLNCLWNDVIHFSALNPQIIVNHLQTIQPDFRLLRTKFFKVNIEHIKQHYDSVIFDRKIRNTENFTIKSNEIRSITDYTELKEIPNETLAYWSQVKMNGGKFLWFMHVPHILVKGCVDTKNFEICKLDI